MFITYLSSLYCIEGDATKMMDYEDSNKTSCNKTGGKAQQGLPLPDCDQGGADGE